jgi:hypothetical protein
VKKPVLYLISLYIQLVISWLYSLLILK